MGTRHTRMHARNGRCRDPHTKGEHGTVTTKAMRARAPSEAGYTHTTAHVRAYKHKLTYSALALANKHLQQKKQQILLCRRLVDHVL